MQESDIEQVTELCYDIAYFFYMSPLEVMKLDFDTIKEMSKQAVRLSNEINKRSKAKV